MDIDTYKQVEIRHGPQGHRGLEEMPSLQTLEGTTVSGLSRDYPYYQQGGGGEHQPSQSEDQELHVLRPYPYHASTSGTAPEDDQQPVPVPEKHGWMHQDRQDRRCIILEAAAASLVVIGVVIGAVLGTQLSSRGSASSAHGSSVSTQTPSTAQATSSSSSPEPSSTAVLTPSAESIPVGTTFNASITVGGNCTGSATCASSSPAASAGGYTASLSQNLYGGGGADGQAWSCGTCWQLTTLWDVTNSTTIVVTVVGDCPATAGNDLCMMKTLEDENVHGMNVNVDLCSDSGATEAMFGSDQGLALGYAVRVQC